MWKQRVIFFHSVVVFLGIASFVSCFTAEFKKPKKEDIRWDGERNCFIPETEAFGLGTAAVLCLGLAQIVGNVVVYIDHRTRHNKTEDGHKAYNLALVRVLLLLSWLSFVVVVLILSTATSMSRRQAYGQGWLDQECYLVKDGIFVASGCLVLLALGALIVAATMIREKKLLDQVNGTLPTKNQEQEEDQIPRKMSETVISIVEEANSTTDISRI
ncbi:PREDICTED: uncharacterized protein LOC104806200 [Tarenaya hassleriana]|uniref:uncharacterized protein LOC104806200 n=1 Tax=Tarenaya hassleriana TaxID=28532 RepID=UPI00053C2427|nr:PREDICTED: uncharacterized protein LOC104806200 [Tarenaya hassleriana]